MTELLEDDLIVPFDSLINETEAAETLTVTESQQYLSRGLLHISDGTYKFLLLLEQQRVNKINENQLLHEKGNMLAAALIKIIGNKQLKATFLLLFQMKKDGDQVSLGGCLHDPTFAGMQ